MFDKMPEKKVWIVNKGEPVENIDIRLKKHIYLKKDIPQQFPLNISLDYVNKYRDVQLCSNPEEYFKRLLCYLGFNPVRKKMVKSPWEYEFCSYRSYMDEKYISPIKITLHEFFLKLGDTFQERVKKFMLYEDAYRKRFSVAFESLA